jgi:hypothetical protein
MWLASNSIDSVHELGAVDVIPEYNTLPGANKVIKVSCQLKEPY